MSSILIKFTSREYIDDFVNGNLFMSSLSKFWDRNNNFEEQKDIFEGVCAVTDIKRNSALPVKWRQLFASDERFRIQAYQYCNLLCFYRVDRDDQNGIVQCIPPMMEKFGDAVIIIRNKEEFLRRVNNAVERERGICCMGDVRYHELTGVKRNIQGVFVSVPGEHSDGAISIESIGRWGKIKAHYGCLDKFNEYSNQREWRICYLPEKYDTADVRLDVGDLSDIVEVYTINEYKEKLLEIDTVVLSAKKFRYGVVADKSYYRDGTVSYAEFKRTVEKIDGKCTLMETI